jgi:hypothetical protein
MQRIGRYEFNDKGTAVWVETDIDVPEGQIIVFDEFPTGAWADPAFLSNILDIMIKSEASNDVKDILMDVELEKLIYDTKN